MRRFKGRRGRRVCSRSSTPGKELAKIPMAKGTRGQLAASSGTVRCVSRVELALCRHVGREALVGSSKIDKKVHGAGIVGDLARVLGVVGFCL